MQQVEHVGGNGDGGLQHGLQLLLVLRILQVASIQEAEVWLRPSSKAGGPTAAAGHGLRG